MCLRGREAAARRSYAADAFGNLAVEFLHAALVPVTAIFNQTFGDALRVGSHLLPADHRRQLGQVAIDIGLAPLAPAEFIIVRIVRSTDRTPDD